MSANKRIVKWFNSVRGFGFIKHKDAGENIFIHCSQIIMNGYKQLSEGQKIEYGLLREEKSFKAANSKLISEYI